MGGMVINRQSHSHRHGVALLEVVLGSILLALGLGVVMTIGSRSLIAQAGGEQKLVAAWLADELLAMVVVQGPDKYRLGTNGYFESPFEKFSYELDIDYRSDQEPYDVMAIVSWPVGKEKRSIEVTTSIARRIGEEEEETPRAPMLPVDRDMRYLEIDA